MRTLATGVELLWPIQRKWFNLVKEPSPGGQIPAERDHSLLGGLGKHCKHSLSQS
jgi:hypothetical protein